MSRSGWAAGPSGAFNLLHEGGYYTDERLARAADVYPFATLAYFALLQSESAPTGT